MNPSAYPEPWPNPPERFQRLLHIGFRLLRHLAGHLLDQPPSPIVANGLELLLLLLIEDRRDFVYDRAADLFQLLDLLQRREFKGARGA